jgi:hypothetical protein
MFNRRSVLALLTSASVIATSGTALAKKKLHKSGKDLLGAKLKKNGKHQVDKVGKGGKANVNVEVKDGKVASMSMTDAEGKEIKGKKVKSKKKMAEMAAPVMIAADNEWIQFAQLDWYYGWYFFYDDVDYYYWYPAEEVYWEDDYWADEDDWLYW